MLNDHTDDSAKSISSYQGCQVVPNLAKYCQNSLFSRKFANFLAIFLCQNFSICEKSIASIDKVIHFVLFKR